MDNTITVWHKGSAMSVYRAVADKLNLKNGEQLKTEARFWEVLRANASFGISICQFEMPKNDN